MTMIQIRERGAAALPRAGLGIVPMLIALAACTSSGRPAREPANARLLDGEWAVDFTLESPLLPGHMPRQQTLRGQLALLRNPSLARPADLSGRPTHSGSYATRFAPFGFEIDGGRMAPALEARVTERDSVEIALQPGDAAGVRMRGVLAGDSVAGTWLYDHARAGAASGRFVMRRQPGIASPQRK
ncbi:MAG TPA: hypothetical protein VFJ16_15545 [Longimicrobium sp.]|nr:hypothetical protein [Longimicrobium sp.]